MLHDLNLSWGTLRLNFVEFCHFHFNCYNLMIFLQCILDQWFSHFPLPRTTKCRQSTYHGPSTSMPLPFTFQTIFLKVRSVAKLEPQWIRWSFAEICCAISLVCPSAAIHRTCQFWTRSEPWNMPKTVESPAKWGVRAVIRFFYS